MKLSLFIIVQYQAETRYLFIVFNLSVISIQIAIWKWYVTEPRVFHNVFMA